MEFDIKIFLQCVTVGERRLTAEDIESEFRKKDMKADELHGQLAAGASELAQVKMDLDWAKDSQRRAEDALVQKRTRKACSSSQRYNNRGDNIAQLKIACMKYMSWALNMASE